MSLYTFNVAAGVPLYVKTPGTVLLVDSISASTGIDITLIKNGAERPKMPARKAAFKINDDFDELILSSAVPITVSLFLSFTDVNLGFQDGANVAIPNGVTVNNLTANPVPVSIATPVTLNATSVQINNTPAQAVPVMLHTSDDTTPIPVDPGARTFLTQEQRLTTIVNIAPVTVGTALVLASNDATLLNLRFRNTSTTATIGLGGAGLASLANAAIVLRPGEICYEDDAAGAAWYAISDTAGTVLAMSGLKP